MLYLKNKKIYDNNIMDKTNLACLKILEPEKHVEKKKKKKPLKKLFVIKPKYAVKK